MMIKMVDNTADDDGSDGADRGDTDVDADADDHENMDNDTTEHDDDAMILYIWKPCKFL